MIKRFDKDPRDRKNGKRRWIGEPENGLSEVGSQWDGKFSKANFQSFRIPSSILWNIAKGDPTGPLDNTIIAVVGGC
ncbi:hypothetical protein RF55_14131 [Lasius niger]|uniref:Uncharacterized protein n=1 Tax=Lasius niger TaxID=67767 RepID=A0A0J7K998_LASNI|nr:hypothetical protein RF55_14131 [Lasius niger]